MTWAKYGAHFFDDLVDCDFPEDLDDACQLTHVQAVHYVYSIESYDCSFLIKKLSRFATSSRAKDAGNALVAAGVWEVDGNRIRLIHHREEIRQSLAAQNVKRERDREKAAEKRRKEAERRALEQHQNEEDATPEPVDVEQAQIEKPREVASDVAATHSFIHSSIHSGIDEGEEASEKEAAVASFLADAGMLPDRRSA